MSKRFVISGVSGAGKSTLINSITEYKKYNEYMDDHHVKFWYEICERGEDTDHNAKNTMLFIRLSKVVHQIQNADDIAVFDRGLIDLVIASELRIKPRDPELHKWFVGLIEENLLKSKPHMVIFLDLTWEEFKNRIKSRGRELENKHLDSDDSWYKKYFDSYKPLFISLCEKYSVNYKVIDVTNNQPLQTKEEVLKIITNM